MASAEIGDLGPKDGRPVTYNFRPYYHVQGVLPWLVLPALFFGFRRNRSWQAAWIWVPVAVLALGFGLFRLLLPVSSGSAVELNAMFIALVGGFAALWLPAHRLERLSFPVTIAILHVIYLGFLGVVVASGAFAGETGDAAFLTVVVLPILWGLMLAAIRCRRSFGRMRFYGWTVGGVFVFQVATLMTLAFLDTWISGYRPEGLVVEVVMASFFLTLILAAGLGIFLLLLLNQPFWLERFCGVFKIDRSAIPEWFELFPSD